MTDFNPTAVRYIKLGTGGMWADEAIGSGTMPFGYHEIDHDLCVAGQWDAVRERLVPHRKSKQGVSSGVREIRDFYEQGPDTLWITFHEGRLWWACADGPVQMLPPAGSERPSRMRKVRGRWCSESLGGKTLLARTLSSSLTCTAAFRGTICEVEQEAYLLRRIRDEAEPLVVKALDVKRDLHGLAQSMIAQLHWKELEILVDLIFARGGWQRCSVLGETQADVDLILDHPTTGERACVQIKARADQAELKSYLDWFENSGVGDRCFFVCHKPMGALTAPDQLGHHLWTGGALAEAAVMAGLFDWLVERIR